jgi:hypothetical protein
VPRIIATRIAPLRVEGNNRAGLARSAESSQQVALNDLDSTTGNDGIDAEGEECGMGVSVGGVERKYRNNQACRVI